MVKLLHWCALRMSDAGRFLADAGERLWELGGALECWCDERAERKRWQRWAKKCGYKVIDVKLAAFDPSELSMPAPRAWPGQEEEMPIILTGNDPEDGVGPGPLRKHVHTVMPRPWPKQED